MFIPCVFCLCCVDFYYQLDVSVKSSTRCTSTGGAAFKPGDFGALTVSSSRTVGSQPLESGGSGLSGRFVSRLIHSCHISVLFFSLLQPVTSASFWNNDTCVWLSSLGKQIELQMKFCVLLLVSRYWNQTFFGNARMRDGFSSVLCWRTAAFT